MKISRKLAVIICALIFGGAILFSPTIMWDGGFRVAEYRINLRNESGEIIKDAAMHVAKSDGSPSSRYPIVEYTSGKPINSRDDGTFVVHQVRSGLQFGGKYTLLFGLFPIGRKGAPKFEITFKKDKIQIYSVEFASLDDGFDYSTASLVKRTFTVGETIEPQLENELNQEELSEIAIEAEFPVIERTLTVQSNKRNKPALDNP